MRSRISRGTSGGGGSEAGLIEIYGVRGEHPDHPVAGWQYEVGEDDTRLGYWAWVAAQLEHDAEDAAANIAGVHAQIVSDAKEG